MKMKNTLRVAVIGLSIIMANMGTSFAAVTDKDIAVPDQGKVTIEYEGNDINSSYNYYRLPVKFGAASENFITVPKSLVIVETNLTPNLDEGETGEPKEVHRANFDAAGEILQGLGDQPYLDKYNAFYYRNFIVKHNAPGTYAYKATLSWVNSNGKELVRTAETTVIIDKGISTQSIMIGNDNNFSRSKWLGDYDPDATFVPKYYSTGSGEDGDDVVEHGFALDKDTGMEIYEGVYSITAEDGLMDKKAWDSNQIDITKFVTEDGSSIDRNVFNANTSLETHVVYTGPHMPGKTVKAFINNPSLEDNSLELGSMREIPDLSEALTRLIQAPQSSASYPNGIYPKEHLEVYMGMGVGPQGDIGEGDNGNDMSFIFGDADTGGLHDSVQFLVVDGDDETTKMTGFIFDFMKLTYNPIIFTGGLKAFDDGFVKPAGFMMLYPKFELKTLAPDVPDDRIEDASIRINLQHVLDGDMTDYSHFTNKDGTPFDGKSIMLTIDDVEIKHEDDPAADSSKPTYIYDPIKKEVLIENAGVIVPTEEYKVKMVIPTKRRDDSKSSKSYNEDIVGVIGDITKPGQTFPITMEIIENHPLLIGRNDQLVRYDVQFTIKPYRMPGIN